MKHRSARLAACCALLLAASAATATPLLVNMTTATVDATTALVGATLLASESTDIANSSYSGTARSAVYATSTGLDFVYQFTNSASSVNGVERLTAFDFSSVGAATVLNVFQTADAFGIFTAGTSVADTADRSALGVIGFNFSPGGNLKINPGLTSDTEIIATQATAYGSGNFGLLDGIGANAAGYAPVASVPEPGAWALLLLGVGGVFWTRRRSPGVTV